MTPLVKKLVEPIDALLEALQRANGEIQQMRDEIAVLKGQKAKPRFKSSKTDQNTGKDQEGGDEGASSQDGDKVKRAGSAKRSKTAALQIHDLSAAVREQLGQTPDFARTLQCWQEHLISLKITDARHVRIATEGALLGSLLDKGFNPALAIVSDGAGQFAIGLHALCWIHAERLIHKLIPINDAQRQAIAGVRGQVWDFYADSKAYKRQPDPGKVAPLQARFDALFKQSTGYYTLDDLLLRLHRRKSELVLVLKRPDIPLHTNGSETDIRDFVKKRKVSGGTRSELGRQCRDTFASLKQTCRKLGISFWLYLLDRVSLTNAITPLPTLIRDAAMTGASP